MANVDKLANGAFEWIKSNQNSINECIQNTLPKEERNAAVGGVVAIGQQRNRVILGALPYGVGQLKSRLIQELGYSNDQAHAAVSRLKQDERLYQIGRGLGKMLVAYSGDPKPAATPQITGTNPQYTFATANFGNTAVAGEQIIINADEPTVATDQETGWTQFTPALLTELDEIKVVVDTPLTPRLAKWLDEVKPAPRKVIKRVAKQGPVAIENPGIADYGDLQEIYDEIETAFKEKFAKLRAKCDELMEENMVLNQATWQS